MNEIICGVDVAKEWLDAHVEPGGASGRFGNDATGIAELVALVLFWAPGLELVGAAALGLVMIGALATLIRHREGRSHVALSAVTLLLLMAQSYRTMGA